MLTTHTLYLEPITHANNGPSGGTFGYIARSYYSCINKTNISRCLVSSGYYLGSPFFCSTSRDSLRIHCNVDISKFFKTLKTKYNLNHYNIIHVNGPAKN